MSVNREHDTTAVPDPIETGDRRGPLFADTGMKLGIFGFNVSSGGGLSKSPTRYEIDWEQNVRLAQRAEAAGFEAAIPFSRWRGFEGETNPWGRSFETYTWAAGLAARTSRITVFATWPNTLYFSEYDRNPVFEDIANFYRALGVEIVGKPQDAMVTKEFLADTIYHLTASGIAMRTSKLIENLKSDGAFTAWIKREHPTDG